MRQHSGFEESRKTHLMCLLKRSLYGLKQSLCQWYEEIDTYLRSNEWTRSQLDPNLYFLRGDLTITVLLLYIDDLLIFGDSSSRVVEIKFQLSLHYKMKDLGMVSRYLGLDIVHTTTGENFMHQTNYITDLRSECNSDTSLIESVPLPVEIVLEANTNTPHVDSSKYCHLVGKLIFLCHTRLDILYAVGLLSRFMHKPQMAHWM